MKLLLDIGASLNLALFILNCTWAGAALATERTQALVFFACAGLAHGLIANCLESIKKKKFPDKEVP